MDCGQNFLNEYACMRSSYYFSYRSCTARPRSGDFYGQLKPVWYPSSWLQVNDTIKDSPDCSAVFLPWHLYYSLSFNNGILTADPSAAFFDCDIIEGQNADIGSIDINASDASTSSAYDAINRAVHR